MGRKRYIRKKCISKKNTKFSTRLTNDRIESTFSDDVHTRRLFSRASSRAVHAGPREAPDRRPCGPANREPAKRGDWPHSQSRARFAELSFLSLGPRSKSQRAQNFPSVRSSPAAGSVKHSSQEATTIAVRRIQRIIRRVHEYIFRIHPSINRILERARHVPVLSHREREFSHVATLLDANARAK